MQTYTAQQLLSPDNANLLEEIVLLIAHSFTEDPSLKWIFFNHTRSQYIAALPTFFRCLVKAALLSDASVTIISGDSAPSSNSRATRSLHQPEIQLPPTSRIRALGVLIPPHGNKTFDSTLTILRAGFFAVLFTCGFGPVWKVATQLAPATDAMLERVYLPPGSSSASQKYNYWHLLFLATHPDGQGQGLGTKILREFQRVATAAVETTKGQESHGAPLYLEASSVGSKRLYHRVGFVERDTVVYGRLGEGEDLRADSEGRIVGGRLFGMSWTP